ncbi:penicillin-binding protein 2 [Candidatus Saccharibacteria bacterium]|nr:penicillin-binding protein 2 [Candidatus Saccharibacteria bacterium]
MIKLTRRQRGELLKIVPVLVFLIVGVRLFDVQILHHDDYVKKASAVRVKQFEILAKRGEIYMMNGEDDVTPLVLNERTWTIFIDPSYVADKNSVQVELTKILGDQMITTWDKVWSNMQNMYVEVAKNVGYETATAVKKANLRGVGRKETSRRAYPAGGLASQVVGFINAEGTASGIEGSQNERLTGTDGMLKTVTDVNSIPLSIGDEHIEEPAKDGETLVLTLDENIQRKVEKVLKTATDNSGGAISAASALIMNPNSGRIYAMANYPSYDPERYWEVKDMSLYTNRTTEAAYEPASVCKTFIYAAALQEGKISPDDTYTNNGCTDVDDRVMCNANKTLKHGVINFRTALDYSFNTGSIEVLRRIGDGRISKAARMTMYNYLTDTFRLGKRTGVEVYEAAGKIISPEEDEGNAVRYANMTFGQGMSLTMVQIASAFSSIVNGGKYYQPTLLAGTMQNDKFVRDEQKEAVSTTISEQTSATMRDMLREVRSVNGGAGDLPGYAVGVKTGTAQTVDEKTGTYSDNKTIAGALGFGGSAREGALPEYVIMIRLDGNKVLWGASDAVPIFTELSNYMLEYLRIEPVK